MRWRVLFAMIAAPAFAGCYGMCDTGIAPGIVVEIRDAHTGEAIADSASGFAIDGTFSDSLAPFSASGDGRLVSRHAAAEREGTYTVIVTRPGYQNWSVSGVRVDEGDCHAETAYLVARLTRI